MKLGAQTLQEYRIVELAPIDPINSDLKVLRFENDQEAIAAAKKLLSGSSEIRNWIAVAAAVKDLKLDWISYVPGYRSRALTGVGLCFAHWH